MVQCELQKFEKPRDKNVPNKKLQIEPSAAYSVHISSITTCTRPCIYMYICIFYTHIAAAHLIPFLPVIQTVSGVTKEKHKYIYKFSILELIDFGVGKRGQQLGEEALLLPFVGISAANLEFNFRVLCFSFYR